MLRPVETNAKRICQEIFACNSFLPFPNVIETVAKATSELNATLAAAIATKLLIN